MKPTNPRLMEVEAQLKKLKQRSGQTVAELTTHLDTLEAQLPEHPSEAQVHSNLPLPT